MESKNVYILVGEAMREIRAVGKDSVNQTQGFKYRGIDAVMNALNPVMAKLGLFFVPEVLEQTREERENVKSVWDNNAKQYRETKNLLKYSILKIRYTLYAPDGSSVSAVVIGEGMDSGDKASNKAMAVGLKYAAFQLFMIPTEEMAQDDPDKESFNVTGVITEPKAPAKAAQVKKPATLAEAINKAVEETKAKKAAEVSTAATLPDPENPVKTYLANERNNVRKARGITPEDNNELFTKQLAVLRAAKRVPEKALSEYTMGEAEDLIALMYAAFTSPTSTELKAVDA